MDLVTGLSAASQALQLIKEIQSTDADLDKAALKLKISELYGSLADVKMALTDAQTEISQLNQKIEELTNGDPCPLCKAPMKVIKSRSHPNFGSFGVQEHTLRCSNNNCSYGEQRMHDPSGRLNGQQP